MTATQDWVAGEKASARKFQDACTAEAQEAACFIGVYEALGFSIFVVHMLIIGVASCSTHWAGPIADGSL